MSRRHHLCRWVLAAAGLVAGSLRGQQAGPLRSTGTAVPGGTIEVEIGCSACSIHVTDTVTGATSFHPVPPGKTVTLRIPDVPVGRRLRIGAGGARGRHELEIEVQAAPT